MEDAGDEFASPLASLLDRPKVAGREEKGAPTVADDSVGESDRSKGKRASRIKPARGDEQSTRLFRVGCLRHGSELGEALGTDRPDPLTGGK
ncbi:MAG: hypothetical protein L3J86_06535 [Thermoplasmata archaeon]|nr:hypothetical protein [Thermoplasmata archaeon]